MKWGLCLAEIWRKLIQAEAGGLPGVRGTGRGVKGGGRAGQVTCGEASLHPRETCWRRGARAKQQRCTCY